MIPSAYGFRLAERERHPQICNTLYLLIQSTAVWTNKWWLHPLLCQLSCLVLYFLEWLHLFVLNKTIKAHLKRLRWEWGGLAPSLPSQGQADCLWLKASSPYRASLWMSDACWQIITGGFMKRPPVDRGELPCGIWCTPSQNVRLGAQRLAAYTNYYTPRTQCHLSNVLRINPDR